MGNGVPEGWELVGMVGWGDGALGRASKQLEPSACETRDWVDGMCLGLLVESSPRHTQRSKRDMK
jgi:hypothetical protein